MTRLQLVANAHARQLLGAAANKTRLGRRSFLKTLIGSAATLLAFNQVYARAGVTGGSFAVPAEVAYDPDVARTVLGGEERICWGTDSLWYGSPQDQIQALRSFEISGSMQERYGYPTFTGHARRRILGLNAAEAYGLDVNELLHAAIMTNWHS